MIWYDMIWYTYIHIYIISQAIYWEFGHQIANTAVAGSEGSDSISSTEGPDGWDKKRRNHQVFLLDHPRRLRSADPSGVCGWCFTIYLPNISNLDWLTVPIWETLMVFENRWCCLIDSLIHSIKKVLFDECTWPYNTYANQGPRHKGIVCQFPCMECSKAETDANMWENIWLVLPVFWPFLAVTFFVGLFKGLNRCDILTWWTSCPKLECVQDWYP